MSKRKLNLSTWKTLALESLLKSPNIINNIPSAKVISIAKRWKLNIFNGKKNTISVFFPIFYLVKNA